MQALETDISTKYLCLSALAAIIDYSEHQAKMCLHTYMMHEGTRNAMHDVCTHRRPRWAPYKTGLVCGGMQPPYMSRLHAYVPQAKMAFVKGTLRIRFSSVEGIMLLDPATATCWYEAVADLSAACAGRAAPGRPLNRGLGSVHAGLPMVRGTGSNGAPHWLGAGRCSGTGAAFASRAPRLALAR